MPASSWKPGYSGRLLFRSFSISSIASDSRPEYLASVSVYRFGFCRRKKKEPERPAKELVWDCALRALKVERYRQIAVEKLYDFQNKTL